MVICKRSFAYNILVSFMYCIINNMKVHFDFEGEGEAIILLHGWGANRYTWDKVFHHLKENYKVFRIDLPGFGETLEPPTALSVLEVCEIVHQFILKMNVHNPIIIGHSYGGRIAIKYASKYETNKLILVSSAGLKHKLSFKKKIGVFWFKLMKKFHIYLKMGSLDYQQASKVLKGMLVKAVNEDQRSDLVKIECPTLLIYGGMDNVTSTRDGKEMESLIKNSGLVIIDKCGHFPYLERFSYFSIVLDSFLECDKCV